MKRLMLVACLLLLVALALPAFLITNHADDWCEIGWARGGPLHSIPVLYQGWTGKYTYAFEVGALKPLSTPWLPTGGALALWALSAYALGRRAGYAWYALLLVGTTIAAAPAVEESFYWQSGVYGYAVGLALLTLGYWALDKHPLIAPLIAFILAGTTDTMAVVQLVAIGVLFVLEPSKRKRLIAVELAALLGLAVVLAAPGNAVRRAMYPPSDTFLAVVFAVRTTGVFLANALRTAPVALAGALIIPALLPIPVSITRRDITRRLLLVLLSVLAINFTASFTAYFATGTPLPTRAEIIPICLSLILLAYGSALVGVRIRQPRPRAAYALALAILAVCFIAAGQNWSLLSHNNFDDTVSWIVACKNNTATGIYVSEIALP